MEVMPDHIHLLVDCRPQFYISDMIKIMKGNIARQMFLAHPELKKELWGGHLWNPSYCCLLYTSTGNKRNNGRRKKKGRLKGLIAAELIVVVVLVMIVGHNPVSYTHLDVYKRQEKR